jgi:subtilase family serine protease
LTAFARHISLCLLLAVTLEIASAQDRITSTVISSVRVAVPNSVHPAIALATSSQAVEPTFPMSHMILLLQPSASQQSAMNTLLVQQQDPKSPNFHKFLTPAQFAAAFGATKNDIAKVTTWLSSNGFQIDEVAPSNLAVVFSGNASQVEAAFNTQIRQYVVSGVTHYANANSGANSCCLQRCCGWSRKAE